MSRTLLSPPSPVSPAPPGPALAHPLAPGGGPVFAPPDARAAKPAFYRVPALARRLGLSKRYLYTLIQQGDLKAVYPSARRLLVPAEAVDRMIEEWRKRPAPDPDAAPSAKQAPAPARTASNLSAKAEPSPKEALQ